jgi:hypothetical protein
MVGMKQNSALCTQGGKPLDTLKIGVVFKHQEWSSRWLQSSNLDPSGLSSILKPIQKQGSQLK